MRIRIYAEQPRNLRDLSCRTAPNINEAQYIAILNRPLNRTSQTSIFLLTRGSFDIVDAGSEKTDYEQDKERREDVLFSSTSTRRDEVMRSEMFFPFGLWRRRFCSCVVPPRRSAKTTPSSARLGSKTCGAHNAAHIHNVKRT